MFTECLAAMEDITTARMGDKTMMDALIPAVEAAQRRRDDLWQISESGQGGGGAGRKGERAVRIQVRKGQKL